MVDVLELIARLYAGEHVAAEQVVLGTEAHRLLRAERSHDIVDAWVDARDGKLGPKTKVSNALTYAQSHRRRTAAVPAKAGGAVLGLEQFARDAAQPQILHELGLLGEPSLTVP